LASKWRTDYVNFQGKARWFKPQAPNQWNRWSHELVLTPESLELFRELQLSQQDTDKITGKPITVNGIMNKLKKDEDGYYTSFSRPCSKEYRGKIRGFEPPLVFQADGKTPLVGVLVGNGSDVTTTCECYTYPNPAGGGYGRALRWYSTRVDNLVPFDNSRDFTDEQHKAKHFLDKLAPEKYVNPF